MNAPAPASAQAFEAFDHLSTMVAVVDAQGRFVHVNSALENVVGVSRRTLLRSSLLDLLGEAATVAQTLSRVAAGQISSARFDAHLRRLLQGGAEVPVHVSVSPLEDTDRLLVEMLHIEQQARLDREERLQSLAQANKELVRNLAHEIKNPLGGIRGSAQLLEMELADPELAEYTQVIIREADRLQSLVDRLLDPHRRPKLVGDVNIHELCERVRTLVLAEHPRGLEVVRDYDISLPEFRGDPEQLMQVLLNIVRNAAQALAERIARGDARIVLRTRAARQVTIARERQRLALELHVQDNGPGVPPELLDRIFHPLVSGRDGGTGLGLTLAQSFVEQHRGAIECESAPGRTLFRILLPLP